MSELNDHSQRAHALLSASGAYRWLECPPSAMAASKYPDESSPYALEGTIAHEVAEAIATGSSEPDALLDKEGVTVEMLNYAAEYRDYIQEHITTAEPVKMFETRVDFSAWVPEGFGTCDCLVIQDNKMDVFDYKYGIGVPVSATDNPQMKLYALGAYHDYGDMLGVEEIEMHIFQPRINNISSFSLSVVDLLEWAIRTVKPIARQAADGKGKYKAGTHCKFCPHAAKCRALAKLCTEVYEKYNLPVLAPFQIAEVIRMEPIITGWLKKVKGQAMADLLDGKEIPGYKVVEGRLGNREWTSEDDVITLLQGEGFGPEDYFETKLKGPAAVDALVGKKKAAELLKDVITRKAGAPTLVPDTDKREAITNAELQLKDFD